jgi:hypothetical protein
MAMTKLEWLISIGTFFLLLLPRRPSDKSEREAWSREVDDINMGRRR